MDVLIADNTEEIFRKEAAELLLKPKKYILGAGCKKGTDSVKLEAFLRKILEEQDIAIEQVAALAKEHGAEELVLGHPVNMDGTLGPRSEKAKAMKVLLEEATSLPVVLWDERRTTIDAHNILFNSGKNAKQRKKVVDAVAASLILEGYLTFKKSR